MLASDVKYSYDMLMSKASSPGYRSMCTDVKSVVVTGERSVRFEFKQRNRELPLIVGSLPVFSKKWTQTVPFEKLTFEEPVTSGPYIIDRYDAGRGIIFKRDPKYWGSKLAVRRGTFNFERVVYRLYKDETAKLEAFKAGEFDAIVEYRAKNWAKSYQGTRFNKGELIKTEFPHRNGAGMQGFVMNMRKPIFKDVRVRQALILALDFEWLNRQLFYGAYKRLDSWFSNSELAASATFDGKPGPGDSRCSTRCARSWRPRFSAPMSRSRRPTRRARCVTTCAPRAACWRRPAGPTPTMRCAMPRASQWCSSSSMMAAP